MKTIMMSLCLSLTCALPAWSKHVDTIKIETGYPETRPTDLMAQYHTERIDPNRAALLNVLPFGFGSYQQGDYIGGVLVTLADLTALAMIGLGISSGNGWGYLIGGGWAITAYVTGRVIGAISPSIHAEMHNKKLRQQLGIEEQAHQRGVSYATAIVGVSHQF